MKREAQRLLGNGHTSPKSINGYGLTSEMESMHVSETPEEKYTKMKNMNAADRVMTWFQKVPDLPSKGEINSIDKTISMSLHFKKPANSNEMTTKKFTPEQLSRMFLGSSDAKSESYLIFPQKITAEVVKSDLPYSMALKCSGLKKFYNHFTDSGEKALMAVHPTDDWNGKRSTSPVTISEMPPVERKDFELFSRYGRLTPTELMKPIKYSEIDDRVAMVPPSSTMASILKLNAQTADPEFLNEFSENSKQNLHDGSLITGRRYVDSIAEQYEKAHDSASSLQSFSIESGLEFQLVRELDGKTNKPKAFDLMDSEVAAFTGSGDSKRLTILDKMEESAAHNLHENFKHVEGTVIIVLAMKYKEVRARKKNPHHMHHHHEGGWVTRKYGRGGYEGY